MRVDGFQEGRDGGKYVPNILLCIYRVLKKLIKALN